MRFLQFLGAFLLLCATYIMPLQAASLLEAEARLDSMIVYSGKMVSLDASRSLNSEGLTGRDIEYRVRWSDKVKFTDWTTNPLFETRFSRIGSYDIILEVRKPGTAIVDRDRKTISVISSGFSTQSFSSSDPDAVFYMNELSGTAKTEFILDASRSRNSLGNNQGLQYRVNWGDGSFLTGPWQSETRFSHRYNTIGDYNVTLYVKDAFGREDTNTVRLSVKPIVGPSMKVRIAPHTGTLNTLYQFTVLPFSGIGTSPERMEARFDFDGDGIWDTDWDSVFKRNYQYSEAGVYTPKIELRDVGGETIGQSGYTLEGFERGTKSLGRILVDSSKMVNASFDMNKNEAVIGDVLYFDASLSKTNTGLPLYYRWDFESDGIWDTSFSLNPSAVHSFSKDGEIEVLLQVKSGTVVDEQIAVVLVDKDDVLPDVDFRYTVTGVSRHPEGLPILGQDVSFNAQVKTYGGRYSRLKYQWDFDGDGVWDTDLVSSPSYRYRYLQVGTFNARLRAQDQKGNERILEKEIVVAENTLPDPVLRVSPSVGVPGTTFVFDGRGSSDFESGSLKYRFDFDGDGVWDTDFANVSQRRFAFDDFGNYVSRMAVSDSLGAISESSFVVEVAENTPPFADISLQRNSNPQLITVSIIGATDDFTPLSQLQYRADFNYDGQVPQYDISFKSINSPTTYRYDSSGVGRKDIFVEIRDRDGGITTIEKSLLVGEDGVVEKVIGQAIEQTIREEGLVGGQTGVDLHNVYGPASRAWFVDLVMRKAGFEKVLLTDVSYFNDISTELSRVQNMINLAATLEVISVPNNSSFRPDDTITRAEALKVIYHAFGFKEASSHALSFPDIPKNNWVIPYVASALEKELVRGFDDGLFRPWRAITKHEALLILERIAK